MRNLFNRIMRWLELSDRKNCDVLTYDEIVANSAPLSCVKLIPKK
jgi:hypothetical protein